MVKIKIKLKKQLRAITQNSMKGRVIIPIHCTLLDDIYVRSFRLIPQILLQLSYIPNRNVRRTCIQEVTCQIFPDFVINTSRV